MKILHVAMFCICGVIPALKGATLTLSIAAYPDISKIMEHVKKTDHGAHTIISNLANPSQVAGIFATYAGMLEASNTSGFITFPRKQTQTHLHVLVTNRITPITMSDQTIYQWERNPEAPATMYLFNRTSDPDTGLTYWDVQNKEIPTDNVIPIDTLIIIAHPNNIFIPTGITLADAGPNLVLPTVYIRKSVDITDDAFYILDLSHLFAQVHLAHVKKPTYYASQPEE
jgi:hypothetical protein